MRVVTPSPRVEIDLRKIISHKQAIKLIEQAQKHSPYSCARVSGWAGRVS